MITKLLAALTADDLNALITNRIEEGRHLDFKRVLPGPTDRDKLEFCADVSSFANTGGGHLLFGVDESGGVASAVPGIPDLNADTAILRMEQILAAGIDPPVPGLGFQCIPTETGEGVVAIHVPRSWRAPHLVKHGGSFRMYARTSRGKQPLDAQEIRQSFESTGNAIDGIRRWRDIRIAKVLADDTPVHLKPGPKMLLHIVPLESVSDPFRISASELDGKPSDFQPIGVRSWGNRINLDGYVTYGGREQQVTRGDDYSYCQVFRSGRVEAVFSELVKEHEGKRVIASVWYEKSVLESTAKYIKSLADLGVTYPIIVMLCFLDARGAEMAVGHDHWELDVHPIDRDLLIFPEVMLGAAPSDMPQSLRPMFDAAWNACGIARSFNYDETGKWIAGNLSGVPVG